MQDVEFRVASKVILGEGLGFNSGLRNAQESRGVLEQDLGFGSGPDLVATGAAGSCALGLHPLQLARKT